MRTFAVLRRRDKGIQWSIALVPLAAIVPLLAFAGWLLFLTARQSGEAVQQGLIESNKALARVVANELDSAVRDLALAGSAVAAADPASLRSDGLPPLASRIIGSTSSFLSLTVVDGSGEAVAASGAAVQPSPAELQRALVSGSAFITHLQPEVGRVDVLQPARHADGSLYVLVGELNLPQMARLLERHVAAGHTASLLDAQRRILARSVHTERFFGAYPSQQTLQALDRSSQGVARFWTRDNQQLLWAWSRLPATGWIVFVGAPAQVFDSALRQSMWRLTLGGLVALLLGGAAAWLAARRIVRPLDGIADQLDNLSWGGTLQCSRTGLRQIDALCAALSEATQRAAKAQKAKDVFIATLSHELRNPLAPIRTGAAVLLGASADEASRRRAVQVIDRQSRALGLLLDDLLDTSRVTSGRLELRLAPVDLAAVMDAAVETARPLLEAKAHRLALAKPASPLRVRGDELRLVQVFANLLNNAAKYTDPGGRIGFEAARDGDRVRLAVTDNGIGLEPASLAAIFEPFVQVPGARGRSQGGLGLGLALVKGLVEMHGGQVRVISEGAGHGSRFEVLLPLEAEAPAAMAASAPRPAAAPASAAVASAPSATAAASVLIVDDNADAADALADLLRAEGYACTVAHTAAEALALPAAHDAACLDIGLPDMSGLELCRRLRADARTRDMRLIALTGWGAAADLERSTAAGFDEHLTKPVDADALLATLRRQLDEARSSPPIAGR